MDTWQKQTHKQTNKTIFEGMKMKFEVAFQTRGHDMKV